MDISIWSGYFNEYSPEKMIDKISELKWGNINWEELVSTLYEINYPYIFNYEIPGESYGPIFLKEARLNYLKSISHNILLKK